MKKLRWQLLVVVLALIAIVVLLVEQQPVRLPGIIDAPVEPKTGGVYSEALIGSLGRLNPLLDIYNPADRDVDRLLFSGLVRFDDRGLPQGDLAETWGISQDETVYNFSIRPNALWHDGEPVTSEDVVFTIEMLRSDDLPIPDDLREFWQQIEVHAIDERTLQFVLPEPFAPFLDYLTTGVLPKHILGDLEPAQLTDHAFNLEPVGTGPYRLDHLLVENGQIEGVVLQAFEDYYADPPFIEQVIFRYFSDGQTALEAYRSGEVQGIGEIPPEILPEALQLPDLNIYTGRMPRLSMIFLNLDDSDVSFFQDSAVRRALLMGLNRQWIVDRVLNGQAIVADGPIFPGTWAYYDDIEHITYNPDEAVVALKDAGYTLPEDGTVREKDGQELAFKLAYPDTAEHTAEVEVIQRNWERLGVQVELVPVSYAELVSDYLDQRQYDAVLVDLNLSRSPDPDPYPFWHQAQISGGQNYSQWDDRQVSEYLEQARVMVDISERARRYRNFQVRFTTEMPALPLYYPVYNYGVDQQVQGVRMGPLFEPSDRFNTIRQWYLQAGVATEEPDISPAGDEAAQAEPTASP